MKPTLLILAAGMASRYGSMKQVDGFGPNHETIIDYSIYDAIRAGFGKICFIIKEEYQKDFKNLFEPKFGDKVELDYVFQEDDLTKYGIEAKIKRSKPWGTGHAILEAATKINEPFCVINADDFYGADSFFKMSDFLQNAVSDNHFALMGYELNKTLSAHGAVSRGICTVDAAGKLNQITERTKVFEKNGLIVFESESSDLVIIPDSAKASMNFWGFSPSIFKHARKLFIDFVYSHVNEPKAEFFIPLIVETLIRENAASFTVIPTDSDWFGVTYPQDKAYVQKRISELIKQGEYPQKLTVNTVESPKKSAGANFIQIWPKRKTGKNLQIQKS